MLMLVYLRDSISFERDDVLQHISELHEAECIQYDENTATFETAYPQDFKEELHSFGYHVEKL